MRFRVLVLAWVALLLVLPSAEGRTGQDGNRKLAGGTPTTASATATAARQTAAVRTLPVAAADAALDAFVKNRYVVTLAPGATSAAVISAVKEGMNHTDIWDRGVKQGANVPDPICWAVHILLSRCE